MDANSYHLVTSEKAYYHIHLDGKITKNEVYQRFAKSLGFSDFPFYSRSGHEPLLHMTKKYRGSDSEYNTAKVDFAQLVSQAPLLGYRGYLEFEKIFLRHTYRYKGAVRETGVEFFGVQKLPFHFTQRQLKIAEGEQFKRFDLHYTISQQSDPAIITALQQTGLLFIVPQYDDTYVFTAQFAASDDAEKHMLQLEKCLLAFTQQYAVLIPKAVLKLEEMVDFFVSDVGQEHLPVVVESCRFD